MKTRRNRDSADRQLRPIAVPWPATSTMHTLESLPVEIFDLILQAVKDDATLQAAVLSCAKFHAAHHHHKLAINAQVLRNAFGGQLSIGAMIRSVRVESAVYEGQAQTARLDEFLDRIRPYKEDLNSVPTPDEYELCTERTRVVEQLEIVYSRWYEIFIIMRLSSFAPDPL